MLRSLFRRISSPFTLSRSDQQPSAIGLHHRPTATACPNHRERVMSMRLEHTKLCGRRRCERLSKLGIVTAGDLVYASLDKAASNFNATHRALQVLKQYRLAVRLAANVPGMLPCDAMLLISIHRRSANRLANESAGSLHRDLERFAESTQGQIQLRGRRVPSARRLRRWIDQCQLRVKHQAVQSTAA